MISRTHAEVQTVSLTLPRFVLRTLLACTLPLPLAVLAQPVPDPLLAPQSERIERLQRELKAQPPRDEAAALALQSEIERAAEIEREADALAADIARLARQPGQDAADATRIERDLAAESDPAATRLLAQLARLPAGPALTERLESERVALAEIQRERAEVGARLSEASARPLALADETARQRRLVDEQRAALATSSASGQDSLAARIRQAAATAEVRLALLRLHQLEAERAALPARQALLELRQRDLERREAEAARRVALLQERAGSAGDAALDALIVRLEAERTRVATAPPPVRDAAVVNRDLGDELAEARRSREQAERSAQGAQHAGGDAQAALAAVRARLAVADAREGLGPLLLEMRRRLESPARLRQQLDATRQALTSARLRAIELAEQRRSLWQREREIEQTLSRFDGDAEGDGNGGDGNVDALREELAAQFATRAELLPQAEQARLDQIVALERLEQSLQLQWQNTIELTALLDRHLLWTPSHEALGIGWLARVPEGLADLAKPSRYLTSLRLHWQWVEAHPMPVAGFALLVAAGFVLRRRAPAPLDALAAPLRQVRSDSYRYTARALGVSLLAALPWALLFWGLGWVLQQAGDAGRFSDSLGRAMHAMVGGILIAEALHWLSRERGLGHAHFRWPRPRREAIRAALPWVVFGLLPLQLVLALGFVRGQEPALDTVARLALLAFSALSAWLLWRLLAPGAVWTFRSREVSEPIAARRLARVGLVAYLAGCALLAMLGYLLTSGILLRALWTSLGVVLAVALAQGMLARWFLLGERRLLARHLEERRASERSAATEDRHEPLPELESDAAALARASITAQTRRLLRATVITLLALGLLAVWTDVLPAFERLKEIALWQFDTIDTEGAKIKGTVALSDLLLGIALLLLTFIAARNLPALVEIALLSRIAIDAPTRYAITSISRYLIVIVGTLAGLSLFGLRWSQLQWMAAALSVGLGFGLQEIFANFVSGLILLFERPFRVGDVITIGDQTGTVSRIRTRATTLVDFDGKEIVVPNKTFITDRLVNWTLSDTRTRVIVRVGVAYGTPPDKVHALLQRVADEHPGVLKDPPARTWFMAFGPSSLDFELRVFVASIQDRLSVLDALNCRIAELFQAEGIEIAFPQLDLHIRDVADKSTPEKSEASRS